MPSPVRLIPLGGLGEIGMNCMALECEDEIIVLDCGVTFDSRGLGVDLIHADLRYLRERRDHVRALVLTHGHEDHIGAASFFLREFDVPAWAPPYAMALVKQRISEHPFHDLADLDLRVMNRGERHRMGHFEWELWHVTHSIPDAYGLVVRTPQGTILHTGDFKVDRDAPFGERMELDHIAEALRAEGVRLMLSDSTNALTEGRAGPEKMVQSSLEELVAESPGRVVVGLFASNVSRIRSLIEIARRTHRKIVPLGRSVDTHLRIGTQLGFLPDPSDVLQARDRARQLPPEKVLGIATGSQGEPPAALPRLAHRTHPDLELGAGDRVILSSRIIPGNERPVLEMTNTFERRGVRVFSRSVDPRIHVSGHAHRDEQREAISLVRPRAFLPVHGTWVHLAAHAQIAREAGVAEVFVIENGGVLELSDQGGRIGESVPSGRVHIDHHEPIADRAIQDRALLARLGVVFVTIITDSYGRLTQAPLVITRGVLDEDAERDTLEDLIDDIDDAVSSIRTHELIISDDILRDTARRAVRRFFVQNFGRKPLCYVTVARPKVA